MGELVRLVNPGLGIAGPRVRLWMLPGEPVMVGRLFGGPVVFSAFFDQLDDDVVPVGLVQARVGALDSFPLLSGGWLDLRPWSALCALPRALAFDRSGRLRRVLVEFTGAAGAGRVAA